MENIGIDVVGNINATKCTYVETLDVHIYAMIVEEDSDATRNVKTIDIKRIVIRSYKITISNSI